MSDIIHLLPDNIANQIAAGEVIQRPASAVKEMLENAIDAGATEIKLIIQDAGKSLVQVIDNGKGMSEMDARMSFERHATSKISKIEDLFSIRTMGFRGEALASIAAVAQVEMKTKKADDEFGTYLEIDNSVVKVQEPCTCNKGTSIAMKNLFFNVPARRNFLKSNASETRHIIDEFIHVAIPFPEIFFSFTSNGQEVFHLEKGSLKQRIIHLLGNSYASKLVSVSENTDYMNISGYVGKPEAAKKTRGDQYIFVNNRFIKSAYLNHAIMNAYQDLIPGESYPMYVLFIDLDPAQLDINVHPTKQEIKFEDEKIVYAFVQAAVKHALAQYSITPTLDFELDPEVQRLDAINKPFTDEKRKNATSSSLYESFTQKNQAHFIDKNSGLKDWKTFFTPSTNASKNEMENPDDVSMDNPLLSDPFSGNKISSSVSLDLTEGGLQIGNNQSADFTGRSITISSQPLQLVADSKLEQLHQQFIFATTNRGFIIIHQQLAHERILYEKFNASADGKPMATQRSLFPATLELSPGDAMLIEDILPDLQHLGYMLEPFGSNCFMIQGTPADIDTGSDKQAIEKLLEQYKHFSSDLKFSIREKLIRAIAKQNAIKSGKLLEKKEMQKLVEDLFSCTYPNTTANGTPTYIEFKKDYLLKLFNLQ